MFSPKMTQAVNEAQTCINACNSEDNISLVAVDNIRKFCGYINELDPDGIKFEKRGLYHSLKIKSYWEKVADCYPELEELLTKLRENKRVLDNTIKTLENKISRYNTVFSEFEQSEQQDNDYMQQLIVARNMQTLLTNTLVNYKTLSEKIEGVLNISKQVLDSAILIAKSTCNISISNNNSVAGIADLAIYKCRYSELRRTLL